MPFDTIYLTRHGHRLNWTIDYKTGTYSSQFPTPTGNPSDPTLTSHGVQQSHELAAHLVSGDVIPKPFRVYTSPFWRCLQTIEPAVRALKGAKEMSKGKQVEGEMGGIDMNAEYEIRVENGLGEWFGSTTFFHHPTPPSLSTLLSLPKPNFEKSELPFTLDTTRSVPILYTSTRGESIPQLHNRLATTLAGIIREVDAEVSELEASLPPEQRSSKAILICSHAAPLIAIGRVLTGHMPEDSSEEDFHVFTAGLSTFRRRKDEAAYRLGYAAQKREGRALAEGTRITDPTATVVPEWDGGKGVGGGWDCVVNGDCSFLSGGAERGWHFNGEESFDTGPMADTASSAEGEMRLGNKL
ncbi:phosphoglycerate mutase family protein [Aspergillus foveolatus]|uniref:phosphoglycerate mutase family protein n=1 Tax=Aspergillus foveolatus TaxID=210207 RepID=UPI003CCE0364